MENIFIIISSVIVIILNVYLGIFVLLKNRSIKIKTSFLFLTLSVSFWVFTILMSWIPIGNKYLDFWSNATFFGPSVLVAALLYFSFVFPKEVKNKYKVPLLSLCAVSLVTVILLAIYQKINIKTYNPWTMERGYGINVFIGYFLVFSSFSFFNLIKSHRISRGIERIQIKFVF